MTQWELARSQAGWERKLYVDQKINMWNHFPVSIAGFGLYLTKWTALADGNATRCFQQQKDNSGTEEKVTGVLRVVEGELVKVFKLGAVVDVLLKERQLAFQLVNRITAAKEHNVNHWKGTYCQAEVLVVDQWQINIF